MENIGGDEGLEKGPESLLTSLLVRGRESEIVEGCGEDTNLRDLLGEETLEMIDPRLKYIIHGISKQTAFIP